MKRMHCFFWALGLLALPALADQVEMLQDTPIMQKGGQQVGTARSGEVYPVLKEKGSWVGIKAGAVKGWVKASYTRKVGASGTSRRKKKRDDALFDEGAQAAATGEGEEEFGSEGGGGHMASGGPMLFDVGGSFATQSVGLGGRAGFAYALPIRSLPAGQRLELGLSGGFYPFAVSSTAHFFDFDFFARYRIGFAGTPIELGPELGMAYVVSSTAPSTVGGVTVGGTASDIMFLGGLLFAYRFGEGWGIDVGTRFWMKGDTFVLFNLGFEKRF